MFQVKIRNLLRIDACIHAIHVFQSRQDNRTYSDFKEPQNVQNDNLDEFECMAFVKDVTTYSSECFLKSVLPNYSCSTLIIELKRKKKIIQRNN